MHSVLLPWCLSVRDTFISQKVVKHKYKQRVVGMERRESERQPLAWRDPNSPLQERYLSRKGTVAASRRQSRHSRLGSINQEEDWRPKRAKTIRDNPFISSSDEEPTSPETPLTPENPGLQPPRLKHRISDLKPGTIIRGQFYAEYTPSAYATPQKQSDNCFETRWGNAYGEERHMIVINQFYEHYVALPVFTHRGTGTSKKRNPFEFVTLHDHRHTKPAKLQSEHKPLFTSNMDKGIYLFRRLSVVHITQPMCKNYFHPVVREGELTPESTAALTELYMKYCPPKIQEECSEGSIRTPITPSLNDFAVGSPSPMSTTDPVSRDREKWGELFGSLKRGRTIIDEPRTPRTPRTPSHSLGKLNLG